MMKPAICSICGTSSLESCDGQWVKFSDYKRLVGEEIGHPDGFEWFCKKHLEDAILLSNKKSSEVLTELRNRYPIVEPRSTVSAKKHWWQLFKTRKK